MEDCFSDLGRYISILDRLMKMYYDRGLAEFEIGWGQQFYVEYSLATAEVSSFAGKIYDKNDSGE